jgi:hypothetical protein
MHTSKTGLFRRFIVCSTFCAVLLSLLTLLQTGSLAVQATSISVDPLVLIVVDATKPGCTLDLSANINTKHSSITHVPCPVGTIMRTEIVHLSQALAKHEDYVLLSSTTATKTVPSKIASAIEKIKQEKYKNIQNVLKVNSLIPFVTACGTEGSAGVTWGATQIFGTSTDHFSVYSSVSWYVLPNPHCNTVALETASMHVNNAYITYGACWSWPKDLYAGSTYGVPGNPCLSTGANLSHSVDLNNTKGYTYEEWVSYNNAGNYYYWCDIPVR